MRKDEFNVVILGLDNAGKTVRGSAMIGGAISTLCRPQTFLEKVKTLFTDAPGLDPDRIAPTIGQNSALLVPLCPWHAQWAGQSAGSL
jgi:ADP-ribosylation factor related protein 1